MGALFLFTSQGIVFIHEGQEWARSKVIAATTVPDKNVGILDHNSYEKDNETNWLNWQEKELNQELVNYYKGLIELRKQFLAFHHSRPKDFAFLDLSIQPAAGYLLQNKFLVILNGNSRKPVIQSLPPGDWHILANEAIVTPEGAKIVTGKIKVAPTSGVILRQSE
ncbi:MAG: hypothetical protein ACE5D2_07440 [Fidelibacterota bacterium]